MAKLENTFSWSRSREATFENCARRYWFQYYGSWGGWEWGADPRTRRIYVLKQLASRWMWAGSVVHDAIERVLKDFRDGRNPEPGEVEEATLAGMRAGFRQSRAGHYLERPKTCALFEHHYAQPLPDSAWVEVADRVRACLRTFWSSPFVAIARDMAPANWLAIEDISSFEFEGTKVWVVPDLAYRTAEGEVWIVDWKTGRDRGTADPIQLACYALYATEHWGVEPNQVHITEYYLSSGTEHARRVDAATLDEVTAAMRESIMAMKALLEDADANVALESAFPCTGAPSRCADCNFKEICPGSDSQTGESGDSHAGSQQLS